MLDIQDHEQSPEPDVLSYRHTQLDNFGGCDEGPCPLVRDGGFV
jgi:hypothetical protein